MRRGSHWSWVLEVERSGEPWIVTGTKGTCLS